MSRKYTNVLLFRVMKLKMFFDPKCSQRISRLYTCQRLRGHFLWKMIEMIVSLHAPPQTRIILVSKIIYSTKTFKSLILAKSEGEKSTLHFLISIRYLQGAFPNLPALMLFIPTYWTCCYLYLHFFAWRLSQGYNVCFIHLTI